MVVTHWPGHPGCPSSEPIASKTRAGQFTARRLRHLADECLSVIRTDLLHTRNQLADRHAPHPGRSTCTEQVPAAEPPYVPALLRHAPSRPHRPLWLPDRAADIPLPSP